MMIALAIIAAYLIGSIPSAYLVTRLRRHEDIRKVGTRNMGAMNVFYKVSFWDGLLVLALDIGKGAAGVALARFLGVGEIIQYIAGFAVLVGHNFPVFLKFRGGKGGASCIGILVFFMPWGIPAYLAVFGLLMLITRFPTLSYGAAFLVFFPIGWFVYKSPSMMIFTACLLLFILIRYLGRVKEMKEKGGSWRRVIKRSSFKDRF